MGAEITSGKAHVLVVEDEEFSRLALETLLRAEGYDVAAAVDGVQALERVAHRPPDVVVTDLQMPRMGGLDLLKELKALGTELPVLVVTASIDVQSAIAAMREGAENFLTKPVNADQLLLAVERALARRAERVEAENLRRHVREHAGAGLQGLLGASAPMQKVYRTAKQVAASKATVLITGESGTGKGELARAIHTLSPRSSQPFVTLHCAALADSLLESELFGHERGSFTGADRRRRGRFEQAHGGTLFLDEIAEIPALTQTKLLRVLQERTLERVGGNDLIAVDVRVIAATHSDLAEQVRTGSFREDLYYRLNVVQVEMPPLRLRGPDVLLLAMHFLQRFAAENRKCVEGLSESARAKIASCRWPGNVRELENAIERAVVMCEGNTVDVDDLPIRSASGFDGALRIPGSTMAEIERYAILKTLDATEGSTARAAEILDISVRTIQYRLHEYGTG